MNDKCYRITFQGSEEVPSLRCYQEEADGCLLLHATHAAQEGYETVVICSEDTDIFIMSLAFHDRIGVSLSQKCGTKAQRKITDISKVATTVGMDVCRALIGMHAILAVTLSVLLLAKGRQRS